MAGAGDLDRAGVLAGQAEAAARAITDPYSQAAALAGLARKTELQHARSLLAQALTAGNWEPLVDVLAQISPDAVIVIADEYLNPSA